MLANEPALHGWALQAESGPILRIVICEIQPRSPRTDRSKAGITRDGTERALDHSGNLIITERSRSARTGLIQQSLMRSV